MISSEHIIEEFIDCSGLNKDRYEYFFPKKRNDQLCFSVWKDGEKYRIKTGYFIGVDWIEKKIKHINVSPKLNFNKEGNVIREVDYLKMLISSLKHDETAKLISDLVIVKWDDPLIKIRQKNDMLTPFIIIDFLNTVKIVVKKGLKKSYYKTTKTHTGRIKGKMLIKQTINMQLSKGHLLSNVCSYDMFGVDNKENRFLKLVLEYIKQYMLSSPLLKDVIAISDILNYISPAFDQVSSNIDVNEVKQMKSNTFFKEYDKGIRLGQMILKRFAYNISNTTKTEILTPPFWIDMPLLFELHVLSLLNDSFPNEMEYHFTTYGNELDFLLKSGELRMVIDAKYIPRWNWTVVDENVRQVSGYSRLSKVYKYLEKTYPESIDCLIIYPEVGSKRISIDSNTFVNDLVSVEKYQGIFKLGIEVPVIDDLISLNKK